MHVLLLKEPRDADSGPDPYIKVDALSLIPLVFNSDVLVYVFSAVVSTALHF